MKRSQLQACAMGAIAAFALALVLNNGSGVRDAQAQVTNPSNQQNSSATAPQRSTTDQTTNQATQPRSTSDREARDDNNWKASVLTGLNVRGRSGDSNIGEIKDLMISNDGRVEYAAVSFGGFLGIGEKLFAVPLDAIELVKTGQDKGYARIDVNEETLKNRQGFDKDHWPNTADKSFVQEGGQRHVERAATTPSVR
jgi:hypothetical protein